MFKRLSVHLPVCLIAACSLMLFPAAASAQQGLPRPTASYSATRTMETEMMNMSSKVYVTPDKERNEMEMAGMKNISIMRRDKKLTWMLMPMQHMYMEHPFGEQSDKKHENPDDYKYELTDVGEEPMNGFPCKKSKLIITKQDGTKMGGFIWTSIKEHIPVKMDALAKMEGKTMRFKMELTDIKVGSQPDDLFEIPEGYTKMAGMPGMGGMGGQPGMQGGQAYGQPGADAGSRRPPASPTGMPPAGAPPSGTPPAQGAGGMPPGMENLPPNIQEMIRQKMKNAGQGQ